MSRLTFRHLSLLGAIACFGGLAFAIVYLQHLRGYEPCPMCIFQRVAMAAAGVFFLVGAVHGPRAWGRWVYSAGALFAAAIGAGIAWRHVWLQSLPADQVPACGPTLDYLLSFLPITEVVTMILKGDGNCAKIDAQWLGITLPGWTLITFIGCALLALLNPVLAARFERRPS